MEQSPNLHLPYLMPSQAQKHVTHNEALDIVDALAQLAFESATLAAPAGAAAEGQRFLVPAGATDAWAGKDGSIACFRDGGWVFYESTDGMLAWAKDTASLWVRHAAAWTEAASVATTGTAAFTSIGVNATADMTNRLAVASDAVLFNHDGDDHRLKVNKAAFSNTCSLLFQDDFGGRAELGLAGSDDLTVKVSADGSSWREALVVPSAGGPVRAPDGIRSPGQMARISTARMTDTFTTTDTLPAATGLSITTTPESTASRFVIRASVFVGADFWNTAPALAVFRNDVKIWPYTAGLMTAHQSLSDTSANSQLISQQIAIECEDAPGTVDPVAYSVRLASTVAGYAAHVNRRDYAASARGESNMSVMEISG